MISTVSVLQRITELSPICAFGCGTGYWTKLLRDVRAVVLAVDAKTTCLKDLTEGLQLPGPLSTLSKVMPRC
jgi:hypothetical protein